MNAQGDSKIDHRWIMRLRSAVVIELTLLSTTTLYVSISNDRILEHNVDLPPHELRRLYEQAMPSLEEDIDAYYEAKKSYTEVLMKALEIRKSREEAAEHDLTAKESEETKQPAQEKPPTPQSSMGDEIRSIIKEMDAVSLGKGKGKGKEKEGPIGKK